MSRTKVLTEYVIVCNSGYLRVMLRSNEAMGLMGLMGLWAKGAKGA